MGGCVVISRFVLRHPWAVLLLAAAVGFAIGSRPRLGGLRWFFGVFYGASTLLSALAGWWPGVGWAAGGLAVAWWGVRRMEWAAAELERIRDEWQAGGTP